MLHKSTNPAPSAPRSFHLPWAAPSFPPTLPFPACHEQNPIFQQVMLCPSVEEEEFPSKPCTQRGQTGSQNHQTGLVAQVPLSGEGQRQEKLYQEQREGKHREKEKENHLIPVKFLKSFQQNDSTAAAAPCRGVWGSLSWQLMNVWIYFPSTPALLTSFQHTDGAQRAQGWE